MNPRERLRLALEAFGKAARVVDADGRVLLSNALALRARAHARTATPSDPRPRLTARQSSVLALIALGKTNREIAVALGLAERTVEGHVASLMRKANVRHRAGLVAPLGGSPAPAPASDYGGNPPVENHGIDEPSRVATLRREMTVERPAGLRFAAAGGSHAGGRR